MRLGSKVLVAAGAAVVLSLVPSVASAGLLRFSNACAGFSACNDAAFVAGAGVPLTFEDFLLAGVGNNSVAGNIYSADFTLSSSVSGTFGGSNSANVQHANGNSNSSEVGPMGTFDGILNIDFASAQGAVGFGTVELSNALEFIRVYNGATLLGTFSPFSGDVFNYEGFVATAGDVITRIELEGGFFAIQNMKYAAGAVPEPASLLLFGSGLALVMLRVKKARS
jgi:hypothetical protein